MARKEADTMQESFERLQRKNRMSLINDFTGKILVGNKKTIMHPLDLSDGLVGFGDWLFETGYQPSLAAIAAYLNVSKGIISECRKDPREYYYYEVQDHLGEPVATQAIIYQDSLETVKYGENVCLLDYLTIDFLIDNYASKHGQTFTNEERIKIHNCKNLYIKRLHKRIVTKEKNVLPTPKTRLRGYPKPCSQVNYKDIYAMCVTGNIVVRKIKFSDILQYFEQISELEWTEIGKNARNPALAIFMLLNNSGHTTCYQNKTITQQVITASEKEVQGYQERLDSVLQESIAENSSKTV